MSVWRSIGSVALLGLLAACSGGGSGGGLTPPPAVTFDPAFGGLAFNHPVKLVQHPDDARRWYVVEQGDGSSRDGRVRTFLSTNPAGTVATAADVEVDLGIDLGSGEQGLLGMAFDPEFATSGEIYLSYTNQDNDRSVLSRWVSVDDGETFDFVEVVLSIRHPLNNHNGGDIAFGSDGFLYYSMGDGGDANDPDDNGQNRNVLLGKILRIDVNAAEDGDTYAVPSDNPFVGNAHCNDIAAPAADPCPEIYAYGFRNPWRMNFDPMNGKLYVGDVGESTQEEIDVVLLGGNYGWDCMEGRVAHTTNATCNPGSFEAPVAVHGRSEAQAITGGAVYRGASIAGLMGFYVYGDFVTRRFFAFDTAVVNAPVQNLALPATQVSAFGQGRDGEIYVLGFGTPSIQKLVQGSG